MFHRLLTLLLLAATILLLLILQGTAPSSTGPGGILAVFFLLYIILFVCLTWVLYLLNILIIKLTQSMVLRKPIRKMTLPHAAYLASILAMAPVMIMGINSIGRVGFYEIVLVIVFVCLGVFYVEKRHV